MIAINRKEHHKLLTAFDELENYLSRDKIIYGEDLRELKARFRHYNQLLQQLANCIDNYEQLRHHLKVNVLAPQLRQARKQFREQNGEEKLKELTEMRHEVKAV